MIRRRALAGLVAALLAAAAAAQQPDLGSAAQREAGKQHYDKFCAQCHGVNGDGNGVAYPYLKPKPRDLTSGKYKIRTTPSGALPTHQDLESIIRRGMSYSSMPAWPQFTEQQLDNLVYYVKSFSEDFANPEYVVAGMTVPKAPAATEESILKGREVYEQLGCIRCHGELGRGDGLSAPTLVDDWGNHIRAADLTAKWTFRGGATREDLFRTFSTGLNGTPMPSYADALSDEDRWHLVNYVDSLSEAVEAKYSTLVVARPVDEEIDPESAELWDGVPEAMFPIVGQIVQPGRNFHPLITHVTVQAVYSPSEIAFRVRWNDLIADTAGTNSPTLEVPPFDPSAAAPAAAAEEDSDDFWGEEAVEQGGDDFWGDEAVEEEGADDFWGEETDAAAPGSSSTSAWSDAVALQLPLTLPTGIRKPYFLLGDPQNPVDLWFFDLAGDAVRRYVGRGSANLAEAEGGTAVLGRASYDQGEWSVVLRRSLRATEGVGFAEQQFVPIAVSVWDGFNEERGNKRGLTQWVYVYVEPREQPSAVGPMIRAALTVLVVELLIVGWLRWRNRKRPAPQRNAALA